MLADGKRLLGEIQILTKRAKKADAHEDEKYGMEGIGVDLPAEIARRKDCLRKIQDAKARVEERQKDADRASGRRDDDDQDPPHRGPRKDFWRMQGTHRKEISSPYTAGGLTAIFL